MCNTDVKAGIPIFFYIGNPELDHHKYETDKQHWIESNRSAYAAMIGNEGVLLISKQEFEAFPKFNQDIVLSHSSRYRISE